MFEDRERTPDALTTCEDDPLTKCCSKKSGPQQLPSTRYYTTQADGPLHQHALSYDEHQTRHDSKVMPSYWVTV